MRHAVRVALRRLRRRAAGRRQILPRVRCRGRRRGIRARRARAEHEQGSARRLMTYASRVEVQMRSVLISGTSSGFGLVIAIELARRGWRVFATMRNLDKRGPLENAIAAAG